MTTRELDRLVSKTEMTPVTKRALKEVRRAVMSGMATDPVVGRYEWTIGVSQRNGAGVRFSFSLRKAQPNGDSQD